MAKMGETQLDVSRLCLGGNVFGWTADQEASFAVLDAFLAAGGNFIDSADSYSAFHPGNKGGESETMIGRWMRARGNRDQVVIATKVGRKPDRLGLSEANIRTAVAESLERLGTDQIDLYYAHADDPETPLQETLGTFDALISEGKVRYVAASNYTAERLEEALRCSDSNGFARYVAVQPNYSLVRRGDYEGALSELCVHEGLAVFPYWVLAAGFLTGKYRPGDGAGVVDSPRAGMASAFLNERGLAVLDAVEEIAGSHATTMAAVSLAWAAAQPGVLAPIASARTTEQLAGLMPMLELELTAEELRRLDSASA